MVQVFEIILTKLGPKKQKKTRGRRTDRAPATLPPLWVGFFWSDPAMLGYAISSFQPVRLQLGKKGEPSGTEGKEAGRAHPPPPSPQLAAIPVIPVRRSCKMAARRGW